MVNAFELKGYRSHHLQCGDGWILSPVDWSNDWQVDREEEAIKNLRQVKYNRSRWSVSNLPGYRAEEPEDAVTIWERSWEDITNAVDGGNLRILSQGVHKRTVLRHHVTLPGGCRDIWLVWQARFTFKPLCVYRLSKRELQRKLGLFPLVVRFGALPLLARVANMYNFWSVDNHDECLPRQTICAPKKA